MVNEIFQGMFNKMAKSLSRVVGITDRSFKVVASSEITEIGKSLDIDLEFGKIEALGGYKGKGITCRLLGNKQLGSWCIYCHGEDEEANNYSSILAVTIDEAIKFYAAKYDKCTFIKDILIDNILTSDIILRQRELRFEDEIPRVCIIIRSLKANDNVCLEAIQSMFSDNDKDYVINISDTDVILVKNISENTTDEDLKKLSLSLINTLLNDKLVKCIASVGPIVYHIKDLLKSYRGAQIALEVRKVFDVNTNVALYTQLGLARLIYQLPETMCKGFLNEVFKKGPIDLIDDELMFTISKFFENSLNVSETSRKLFVHRNTLVYRVEKIKKITGLDLRDFEHAIVFKIALMVNKYLKEKPIKY